MICAARQYGLTLLKVRPRSEREFRDRLSRKGFPADLIQTVVESFKQQGLLDDQKFSRYFAQGQLAVRVVGRERLLQQLEAKGISKETAVAAVAQATEGVAELDLARQLAKNRLGALKGLSQPAVQRRLSGFLSRRGFSEEMVTRVIQEVVG